ncbi:MAG: hypothetical protein ACFFGZ_15475 [Candidatus Thorarchaeota archaeon]
MAYAKTKRFFGIFLQIILILLINSSFQTFANIESHYIIASPSNEISMHPLLFFSTDLNGDSVGDVIWGSRDLILAFDVRSRDILWINTSSISNIEAISIIEQEQQPIGLVAANATAFGLIRLHDGYESMTYSIYPEEVSLISTGILDSDIDPVIVIATKNGSLLCVGSNQDAQWNRTFAETIHVLEIGDLNSNGADDVIIATETGISALEGSSGLLLGSWLTSSNIAQIHIHGNEKSQLSFIALDSGGNVTGYSIEVSAPIWSAGPFTEVGWAGLAPIFPANRSLDFVVATRDGWISRRSGTSGERVWDRHISANITGNFIASDLTAAEPWEILFSTHETTSEKAIRKIMAISGQNGATLMQSQLQGDIALVASADWNGDAQGDVGAGSTDGWVYLINFLNGRPIWDVNIELKFILASTSEPVSTTISSTPDISATSDTKRSTNASNLPIAEASATLAILCIATIVLFFVTRRFRDH